MTNEINIGTLKMPINSATKTFAVLAKRGAGKSYSGAVMAEEFYKNNNLDIKKRDEILNKLRNVLGTGTVEVLQNIQSSSLQMWFDKLGNGTSTKILKFLAEKSGMTFTRSQIALATGYSSNSGSFSNSLSLLRRNLLIKEEGGRIKINPDL